MTGIFENKYMVIKKEEKILDCKFVENLEMDLEIAKICVADRIKFSKGISYPAMIDMSGLRSVTKEAREYMGKEGAALITAGALIVHSPLTQILGNLFLTLNKPKVPTKIFTDKNDAREWLKQFPVLNTQETNEQ